jgi:Transposase DDE domain/Insertion element 4 transposase N-terminal
MLLKQEQSMARTKKQLQINLADHLSFALLVLNCPMQAVKAALAAHDAHSQRSRKMAHEVLIFYVLCMCLYRRYNSEDVVLIVLEGLRSIYGDAIGTQSVTKGAISTARKQIGSAPLRSLYESQVTVIGGAQMAGVFYRQWRVMALDGSTLDVADEQANAQEFGRPASSRGHAAYPQLRFCALAECATSVLIGAHCGACASSEMSLARQVIAKSATSGMLIICDRYYVGYAMWQAVIGTGAQALIRLKKSQQLPVLQVLSDGSYISEIYPDEKNRRAARGTRLRVIEYRVGAGLEIYRLATSVLDESQGPAHEMAQLYERRWKIELALDEIKTHLNENLTLRSKTPELVKQEFYALLLVHAAIRGLMTKAAQSTVQKSEDLSFTQAVRILHRRLAATAALPP